MTVTELPRPAAQAEPPGETVRWRPSRAGVVNLWRFYAETFTFHDGRLLLRGPNGSGKSKALELLLPFLLDADLRPHRLSTFGGTERTMHWNLMGDGYDGVNRVGYVWLELHRPTGGGEAGDGEWFSCGARLQASTHTTRVGATYFVTRQRIGVPGGLSLLADGAPLTRQALAAAIGDAGQSFDTGADYRRAVRHALFPGLGHDRYDALIATLLQLRTPKLSEHLDPSVLSTLLSKALPPLDQADIAEIAEGFERLDRQREQLGRLDDEVRGAERLADRQRRYARRVLRAAAHALTSATSAMDAVTRTARESAEELARVVSRITAIDEREAALASEDRAAEARIEGIRRSDEYQQGSRLDGLRSAFRDARRRAEQARAHAGRLAEATEKAERAAATAEGAAASAERRASELAGDAEHAGRTAGLDATYEEVAATADLGAARRLLRAGADGRHGQIEEVRTAVAAHAAAVHRREDAEAQLDETRDLLARAEDVRRDAERGHEAAVAQLATDLAGWAGGCVELRAVDGDLGAALSAVAADEVRVGELVHGAATALRQDWAGQRAERRAARDALGRAREEYAAERSRVEREVDVPPPAPRTRAADRTSMAGAALWRLVAFRPDVDASAQAGVEAALEAAGLLDAWVLPDGTVTAAGHDDTFAEAALATPAPGTSLAAVLEPEPETSVPADRVRALLAGVAYGAAAPDHVAAVGSDGSWRLSAAHGRWSKAEPAYIGAVARERARQRRIAELSALVDDLDEQMAVHTAALDELAARGATLDRELAARPSHQPVRTAAASLDRAAADVAARADAVHRAEEHLARCEARVAARLKELAAAAARHRLPTAADALDRLAASVAAFRTAADTWLDARHTAQGLRTQAGTARDHAEETRRLAGDAASAAAEREAEKERVGAELDAVESSIGVEYRELVDQVQRMRRRRDGIGTERRELSGEAKDLHGHRGALAERRDSLERDREAAVSTRDEAADRFRHLAAGSLAEDTGVEVGSVEQTRAALDTARRVADALGTTPYEPDQLRRAEAGVADLMHEVEPVLAGRADLSFDLDIDIRVLTATVDGVRVGARRLAELLAGERDEARRQLTESERELFDRTLTGDTRRHLAGRIRQATELVAAMRDRLERVRTASKVRVSLAWQVDPELPAGTREARDLLLRDPASLTEQEREALHRFFRDRVDEAREKDTATGWEQQLLEVLDYTAWHQFVVRVDRGDGAGWQQVTKRVHGTMSGGEKAVVLHLPLFAAAAAHYESVPEAPRLILLDEVFVGIDATGNRGQLFDLLVALDLDLVLTSDHEWCSYAELPGIAIHSLLTGADGDDAVTTARFVWDGHGPYPADEPDEVDLGLLGAL